MIDRKVMREVVRGPLQQLDGVTEAMLRWENRTDDPPGATEIYIEERFIAFGEQPIGSDYDRLTGEMRFSVVVPRGSGTEAGDTLATQIKALYKAGQSLVGQIVVVVESSEILSGRTKDQVRYAIPVAISIRVDALRNGGI